MTSLQDKLKRLVEFSGTRHSATHPCAQECSGYRQGFDDGCVAISDRRKPLLDALIECVGPCKELIEWTENNSVYTGSAKRSQKALANLERVVKDLEG